MNIEILSAEERAQLTQKTIGSVELSDDALTNVTGAFGRFGCDPWRGGRIRSGGSWYGGRRGGSYDFDDFGGFGFEGGFGFGYEGGCGSCGGCC